MLKNLLLITTLICVADVSAVAQPLDARGGDRFAVSPDIFTQAQLAELRPYLASLAAGSPSIARKVDQLGTAGFAALHEAIQAYINLDDDAPPRTHAAFHALLLRLADSAIAPYELTEFYSPQLAAYLVASPDEQPSKTRLFHRLLQSGQERSPYELAVSLCPGVSLDYLAHAQGDDAHAAELFDAWRRRWAHSPETRPIADLDHLLEHIAEHFSFDLPDRRRTAQLVFLAAWPQVRSRYEALVAQGLVSDDAKIVAACLEAQGDKPVHLSLNEAILQRFANERELRSAALRNFALDTAGDHAATLGRIWRTLPATAGRERYYCLYAMGVHHHGNAGVALEAIRSDDFSLIEPAVVVLEHASDADAAAAAVDLILNHRTRGHHEALTLATKKQLPGFEARALELAHHDKDLIVRLAAMHYLSQAPGSFRMQLANDLTHPDDDLRLAAIQAFRSPAGLTAAHRETLGPQLAHVFLNDPSQGHRNEALFALAMWRDPATRSTFAHVLKTYESRDFSGFTSDPASYWAYRHRLVALLGLAMLGDQPALNTLRDMHARGGPHQRMDVLLAFHELGIAPDAAFADLDSPELKLAATAARLIHVHGSAAQQQRLHDHFANKPIWQRFAENGVPDWHLLHYAGVASEHAAAHEHEHEHLHHHDHDHGHEHEHE